MRPLKKIQMKIDWLALPGIPAGAEIWERLPVRRCSFLGLQDDQPRTRWKLESFVDEVLPQYNEHSIVIGHDLGGVVACMAALRKAPRALVLSGTALGSWWFWTRRSADPIVHYFFYHMFKGTLFVRLGGGDDTADRFSKQNGVHHDPRKMRILAKHMKPPKGLAESVATICPVFLIWGKKEVFYPGFIAKSLSKKMNAPIFWNDGGHYCMWTHTQSFLESMVHIEEELCSKH